MIYHIYLDMIVGITDNNSFDVLEDCGDDDAHPKAGLYLQRGEKPLSRMCLNTALTKNAKAKFNGLNKTDAFSEWHKNNSLTQLAFSSIHHQLASIQVAHLLCRGGTMAAWRSQPRRRVPLSPQWPSGSPHLLAGGCGNESSSPPFPWRSTGTSLSVKWRSCFGAQCGQARARLAWNGDLVLVRIKALRVHATIADDVAVRFGDVPSSAAPVTITGAAIQQVLWAQGDEEAVFLLHLTLQSSQRAEGPAGATITLEKRQHLSKLLIYLPPFIGLQQPTWFWTGLTRPYVLQSTLGGLSKASLFSKIPFLTGTLSSTLSLFIFSLISSAVLRDNWAGKNEEMLPSLPNAWTRNGK